MPPLQEDPKQTLYFAHLFFADHVLSTAWLVFFAVVWWVYTPHDGRRQANSKAQEDMMNAGPGLSGHNMTESERVAAATSIWNEEKGTATAVIVLGWLAKVRTHVSTIQICRTSKCFTALIIFSFRYTSQPYFTPMQFTSAKALTAPSPAPGRP